MKTRLCFYGWLFSRMFFILFYAAWFFVAWLIILIWSFKPGQLYSTGRLWNKSLCFMSLSKNYWLYKEPPADPEPAMSEQ